MTDMEHDVASQASNRTKHVSETGPQDDLGWTCVTGHVEKDGRTKILRMKADSGSNHNLIIKSRALALADDFVEKKDTLLIKRLAWSQMPIVGEVWLRFSLRGQPGKYYRCKFYVIEDSDADMAFSALACAKLSNEMQVIVPGKNANSGI